MQPLLQEADSVMDWQHADAEAVVRALCAKWEIDFGDATQWLVDSGLLRSINKQASELDEAAWAEAVQVMLGLANPATSLEGVEEMSASLSDAGSDVLSISSSSTFTSLSACSAFTYGSGGTDLGRLLLSLDLGAERKKDPAAQVLSLNLDAERKQDPAARKKGGGTDTDRLIESLLLSSTECKKDPAAQVLSLDLDAELKQDPAALKKGGGTDFDRLLDSLLLSPTECKKDPAAQLLSLNLGAERKKDPAARKKGGSVGIARELTPAPKKFTPARTGVGHQLSFNLAQNA